MNKLFATVIITIALVLCAMIGYSSIIQSSFALETKESLVDVKNSNIKAYSIKITPRDGAHSSLPDCDTPPPPCLSMDRNHSTFKVSFCLACEDNTGDRLYQPNAAIAFTNAPSYNVIGPVPAFPASLDCGGSNSQFNTNYEVEFNAPLSNTSPESLAIHVTAFTHPSDTIPPIDTTFVFPVCGP